MLKGLTFPSIALLCLSMSAGCTRDVAEPVDAARLGIFLDAYIDRGMFIDPSSRTRLAYRTAAVDLNGDDVDELLVYFISREFCGSGGCTLLVLTPRACSYRLVTSISIAREPIRVLDTRSNGWRNLSVIVSGGGILVPYEAELPFDGESYASNPTMPPARKAKRATSGETLLERRPVGEVDGEILIRGP